MKKVKFFCSCFCFFQHYIFGRLENVNNKFSEKDLLHMIDSELIALSEEEIKELINKELEKDNSVVDMNYVDLCFDLLEAKKAINNPSKVKEEKTRIKKPVKIILIAAVFVAIIVSTLTVSAQILKFNIPSKIVQLLSGDDGFICNLENADTTADGYTLSDTDLAKSIAYFGITPVTFPEEMIKEDCEVIKLENTTLDESIAKELSVEFYYKNSYGRLSVSKYSKEYEWRGNSDIALDVKTSRMINVNGMDVLVFEEKNNCTIIYKNDLTNYNIYIECDFETAIKFAESIK